MSENDKKDEGVKVNDGTTEEGQKNYPSYLFMQNRIAELESVLIELNRILDFSEPVSKSCPLDIANYTAINKAFKKAETLLPKAEGE